MSSTVAVSRLTPAWFDMRTAPFAGGYFVGDSTGPSHLGTRLDSLLVGTNSEDLTNRTDAVHRTAQ